MSTVKNGSWASSLLCLLVACIGHSGANVAQAWVVGIDQRVPAERAPYAHRIGYLSTVSIESEAEIDPRWPGPGFPKRQAPASHCSGVLIGQDTVLTNYHCVTNSHNDDPFYIQNNSVLLKRRLLVRGPGVGNDGIGVWGAPYVGNRFLADPRRGYIVDQLDCGEWGRDYAIIRLPARLPSDPPRHPFPSAQIGPIEGVYDSPSWAQGFPLTFYPELTRIRSAGVPLGEVAYPVFSFGLAPKEDGAVGPRAHAYVYTHGHFAPLATPPAAGRSTSFIHTLDTTPGQSGSPIFMKAQDGSIRLVALHNADALSACTRGSLHRYSSGAELLADRVYQANAAVALTPQVLSRVQSLISASRAPALAEFFGLTPPGAPVAQVLASRVTLTWSSSKPNPRAAERLRPVMYLVERCVIANTGCTTASHVQAPQDAPRVQVVTSQPKGSTYHYRVRVADNEGNLSPYSPATAVVVR